MIKIFVLVLFFQGGYRGGSSTIDFVNHQECIATGEMIAKDFAGFNSKLFWRCIEKTAISR